MPKSQKGNGIVINLFPTSLFNRKTNVHLTLKSWKITNIHVSIAQKSIYHEEEKSKDFVATRVE